MIGYRIAPVLLVGLLLAAGPSSARAQPPAPPPAVAVKLIPPTDAAAIKRTDALVAAYPYFSGTVLVARNGKPVFRKAYGLANREWNIANTPETKFRLGSLTKAFTAVSILQLQEAGKLSVEDPVSKYYPAAPEAWKAITLRHLLNHTSGIPTMTANAAFMQRESRLSYTPDQLIELTRDQPLRFTPGSRFEYDNSGYILLGKVIEVVSGEPYAVYIDKHIFQPLGMTSSGHDAEEPIIANRASGYSESRGEIQNAAAISMTVPYAAGSIYSTVDDMLRWDRALKSGPLISDASRKAMFTPALNGYGFGWGLDQKLGHVRISHSGGVNGFVTQFHRYPDDGLTVVVLSNTEYGPVGPVADGLGSIWLGAPASVSPPGWEAALRTTLEDVARGAPDYARLSPGLANATRVQLPSLQPNLAGLGPIQSVTYISGGGPTSPAQYRVKLARGSLEVSFGLAPDGKVQGIGLRPTLGVTMPWTYPPPPAPPPTEAQRQAAFKANDKNSDGKLDRAEYLGVLQALGSAPQIDTLFPQRDVNRDGFVTAEEYKVPIQ